MSNHFISIQYNYILFSKYNTNKLKTIIIVNSQILLSLFFICLIKLLFNIECNLNVIQNVGEFF